MSRLDGIPSGVPALVLGLGLALAEPAAAQRLEARFDSDRALPSPESPAIEIAKWTAGTLAAGAYIAAFVIQNDAENRLETIERLCTESPPSCAATTPGEAYADPALEAQYQDIRSDYRDSRLLLLGAHALAAAGVVLFILDLPRDPTPENIPYEPRSLRVGVRADGAIEASWRLGAL